MKKKLPDIIEKGRLLKLDYPDYPYASDISYGQNGMFEVKINKQSYTLLISDQGGWDHISVSKPKERIPTWKEMCMIKHLLFDDDEVVLQYHPRKKDYVNLHPGVLHLWRPQNEAIPTPPIEYV